MRTTYAYQAFEAQVLEVLRKAGVKDPQLEIPPAGINADLALPCFELAKTQKRNPVEIAAELANKINPTNLIEDVSAAGPYLNFHVNVGRLGQLALSEIFKLKDKYGSSKSNAGKKVIIDYSHPNPTHPMGVGHARTTFLGEAVARLLEFQGYRPIRLCYINDVGKQVASLVLAYQKWGRGAKPPKNKKPDAWLYPLYVRFFREVKKQPALDARAEELLRKFEAGDKKVAADFKKIVGWCLAGFKQTWSDIGIRFDIFPLESQHIKASRVIVEHLKKIGAARVSEDAIILDLEKEGLGIAVIARADGTTLYLTRDIPHLLWRFETYSPEKNIYVVGEDQTLHFKQLFRTVELLGHKDWVSKSFHLRYAFVNFKGKRMSARKGSIILLDELLAEGAKMASAEVKKRWPGLAAAETAKRAKQITLAALIYYILRYSLEKFVNFSWKNALRFEGDTGPYLQYSYTRALSILKKAGAVRTMRFDVGLLKNPDEIALIRALARFPTVAANAAAQLAPHAVANYLFETAQLFNLFYEKHPVIKAEAKTRAARLALVAAAAQMLKNGLQLLNISTPEKM